MKSEDPMDSNTGIQTHTLDQFLEKMGFSGQTNDLSVFSIDEEQKRTQVFKDPILYPFRSDHVSFILVLEGELRVKLNLIEYLVMENHIIAMAPHDVRQFIDMSPGSRTKSVNFKMSYLAKTGIHRKHIEAFEFMPAQGSPLAKLQREDVEILLKMMEILAVKNAAVNCEAYHEEVMVNIFAGFMYEVGSHFRQQQLYEEIKVTRKEELVMRFMKILPLHFKTTKSVQLYASMLNITPKYLSQTLKEITGKTASDFIDEMVMLEAKVLLNDPSLSISQVSDCLGFSDQFFFSNYFKKHSGKSPSGYRKS